jgi:hypothetical protein
MTTSYPSCSPTTPSLASRPLINRGVFHDFAWWVRPLLVLLALASLAVTLRDLGRHTDSVAVFANALAFGWLAVVVAALLSKRRLGLTRTVLLVCIALGLLRAVVSIWGAPLGWTLTESIDARGGFSATQIHTADLSFQPGDVPAHLINDTTKFNFRGDRENDPDRTTLPVTVTARAFVAGDGALLISASSPIRITAGSEVTELRPPIVDFRRGISVAEETPVEIAMVPTGVDKAALRVRPVDVTVYAQPAAGSLMTLRCWLGQAAGVLNLSIVFGSLWIAAAAVRCRLRRLPRGRFAMVGLVGLILFLVVLPGLLTWLAQRESLLVLSGGDDWLTYESFARDIRDNSILMLSGKPLGSADAFYYQPLYPYAVAIGHLVVGDSAQGIILLQLLGVGLVLLLAFLSLPESASAVVALALVVLGSGISQEWATMAGRLLSENLSMVVYGLLLYLVSRLRPVPSVASLALLGILLGIAGLARSTSWVAVPFIIILLFRGTTRRDLPARLAVLVVPMVMLAALVPARNVVAAGTPALLPTSGSINLYMGNVPTGRKLTGEPWIALSRTYDARLVAVAEAVVNVPDQVAKRIAEKAIYVLGFPRSMDAGNPAIFWPILSLWILALLGFLTRAHSRLEWTCLILAATHALSLVLIFPNNYYYRLAMPATLPLAIWDAIALARLASGLPDPNWAGAQAKRLARSLVGAENERL